MTRRAAVCAWPKAPGERRGRGPAWEKEMHARGGERRKLEEKTWRRLFFFGGGVARGWGGTQDAVQPSRLHVPIADVQEREVLVGLPLMLVAEFHVPGT